MVTGVEAAGLALAILPLVIEAAKAYSKGVQSIKNVVTAAPRDEKLQEFYEYFWWETFFLDESLRGIVNDLPLLCHDCKQSLYSDKSLILWEDDKEVQRSLLAYFGTEERLDAFLLILSRLLELVDRLTRDKTTKLSSSDKDSQGVYKRLKQFTDDRTKHKNKSAFLDRFKFFKDEKNRSVAIRNLRWWNKRLEGLSDLRVRRVEQQAVSKPSSSFSQIRTLFNSFFSVVGNHWSCTCATRHKAMICLKSWASHTRDGSPSELEFEVLLPRVTDQQASMQWLEGSVLVQSRVAGEKADRAPLPKICDALKEEQDSALRFLVNTAECQSTLWRMRSKPRQFSWLNNQPPTTLYTSLSSRMLTRLKEKRILALKFAYAMLQYHVGSFMTDILQKESIYFYPLDANSTDFGTPFVMTGFESRATATPSPSMALQHRYPPILRLGVLLLEIHKGALFETLLSASEAASRSPNRNLEAARRLVENLEEWCSETYKDAIRACLELSWVPVGEQVNLENPVVCGGFLEQIIKPLESEYKHLFKLKI